MPDHQPDIEPHADICPGLPRFTTDSVGHWTASCDLCGTHEVTGCESRREAGARFYGGEQPSLYGFDHFEQPQPPAVTPTMPGMTIQANAPLQHLNLSCTSRPVDFFARFVARGWMILDAPYQRGEVWTVKQRLTLVRSWLMGEPVPAVVINDRTTSTWTDPGRDSDVMYAVIGGKQRILTAIAWFNGELAVPASWFDRDHIRVTEDGDGGGAYVRMTGLTEVGRRIFENRMNMPCLESRLADVAQEAQLYLLVNGAGIPQTPLDMDRAGHIAAGTH